MDDWRKNLSPDELREIELEDEQLSRQGRIHRKRARDAMRMAGKRAAARAGKNAPDWLTDEQRAETFSIYLAAQRLSDIRREKFQVDHIVPLRGCYIDKDTGAYVHYISGLHIPTNLRLILAAHNRERSDRLYTADPLIVPDDDEIPF